MLKRYIDLKDLRELRFGQAKDTAKSHVAALFQYTSVGALSRRERAGVRGSVYPQSLLAELWITCSPLSAPHVNQALQLSDQKTTSLSHGFSGLFILDN
ncbi:hypothetical protein BK672_15480 [Pseudomonas fluorescens]|uniref:Uncharacterized protein n=1 Tax=Pseudomonas fluorescens TaxID=294 RepID=A0A423N8G1_PSEFL|nr:hypothetical protein BK672_15480 [Pseudomonas fluorescens]